MSITDELRRYINGPAKSGISHICEKAIANIADRIDAEHEKAMSRAGQLLADAEHNRNCYYLNWQDCKQKVLQGNITVDELSARIERLEDELSHSIELPKDANDVPIHVGDMMERGKTRGHVIALMLSEYPKKWGGGLHWAVQLEGEQAPTALDGLFLHYHVQTVEDVLREFADRVCNSGHQWGLDAADTIAEYAAKLRLAEDKE